MDLEQQPTNGSSRSMDERQSSSTELEAQTSTTQATTYLARFTNTRFFGGFLVSVLTLLYMTMWWNRFLGSGSDGVLMVMGQSLLRGEFPYRDFYMVVPPGMVLKFAAMIHIFGESLTNIRAVGVFERVLLALLVYVWLTRLFSPKPAVLGTLLSVILFSGDIADVVAYYPSDAAIWSVAAALCAAVALERGDPGRRLPWAIASGVLGGVAALIKQSTGLGVMLLLPAVCGAVTLRLNGLRSSLTIILAFAFGSAIPIGIVIGWLVQAGAFDPFVDQVFKEGVSSKGSLFVVLIRPLVQPLGSGQLEAILAAAVLLLLYVIWRYSVSSRTEYSGPIVFHAAQGLALSSVAMVCLVTFGGSDNFKVRTPQLIVAMISLYGTAVLSLYGFWRYLKGPFNGRDAQFLLFASFSFAHSYLVGMSWAPYEPMALPGIALLLCLALSRGCGPGERWRGVAHSLVVASFVAIFFATCLKFFIPFSWTTWTDPPVFLATQSSKLASLNGMRLPADTINTVEKVTELITRNSRPEDHIFVFPYLPLFYVFSGRQPSLFAVVHWFDVAPDRLCREEARRLVEKKPRVIVYQEIGPATLQLSEKEFRGGRPSGQRELIGAIHELTKSYRLAGSVSQSARQNPIKVYVRADR
jgi:hypothetical protein